MPTVADRVAQTVVARQLEAKVEPIFHPDSYGYRPGRSALDAVAACRQRCWKNDWVIDLDIRKFFDSVPWDLVVKAVRGTHRPAVGAAVCASGGCRAAAAARRDPAAAGPRNPAGVGGLARAGEPVHALRVRRVDGPGVPGGPSSSATPTTRSCTASASAQAREVLAGDRGTDGAGRAASCIRTRPGSCTARTATGGGSLRAHRVHVPGVHVPARAARDRNGDDVHWRSCPRSARTP